MWLLWAFVPQIGCPVPSTPSLLAIFSVANTVEICEVDERTVNDLDRFFLLFAGCRSWLIPALVHVEILFSQAQVKLVEALLLSIEIGSLVDVLNCGVWLGCHCQIRVQWLFEFILSMREGKFPEDASANVQLNADELIVLIKRTA